MSSRIDHPIEPVKLVFRSGDVETRSKILP
nr:MAG TPA: hypothetical protein [Caudoviricetes sp.]